MSKELKYSDEDVKARVDELLEAEIEKIDKEGIIETLKEEKATLETEKASLEAEKTNLTQKLEDIKDEFDGYVSPEDVESKVEAAIADAMAKLERHNVRIAELTEAGVKIDEELSEKLDDMDNEAYALLVKVATAVATATPVVEKKDEKEKGEDEEITTPVKASEIKTEPLPNSGNEDKPTSVDRASELMRKIIRGE